MLFYSKCHNVLPTAGYCGYEYRSDENAHSSESCQQTQCS